MSSRSRSLLFNVAMTVGQKRIKREWSRVLSRSAPLCLTAARLPVENACCERAIASNARHASSCALDHLACWRSYCSILLNDGRESPGYSASLLRNERTTGSKEAEIDRAQGAATGTQTMPLCVNSTAVQQVLLCMVQKRQSTMVQIFSSISV